MTSRESTWLNAGAYDIFDVMRYVFLPLLCLLACGDSGTQQDAGSERDGGMLVDGAADSVSDAADGNSGDGGPRSGVFVAIDGDDANPGTFDRPLATFEAARDRLRARDEVDNATVYIRGGVYERNQAFVLTAEDSGTAERPVRYLAYPGETVVVSGGVDAAFSDLQVPSADVLELVPVASRDRVRALDLADLGVSIEDFGSIRYWQFGGYGYDNAPGALVFEGERLEYARYPKQDEGPDGDGFIRTGRVLHPGWDLRNGGNDEDDPVGATFEYADDFVSTWSTTWAARGNLWMYGYWQVPYGDGTLQVESLDTAAGTVATVQSSWYAVGEDKRYYFFNAIDALEQPGEYVVDEPAERIYLIPPAGFSTDSQLQIAVLDAPLVHLDGAEHVVFDGLDFKLGRQDAVRVEDASFVRIANFEIRDIEGVGVRMPGEGSYGNVIENGLMEGVGEACFIIGGGDSIAQTPGESRAENVRCERFGIVEGGRSFLSGVGNVVRHCAFSQSKSGALGFRGQGLVIEYNIFTDLGWTANDAGAVYSGRNPTDAGNEVRFNYFAHIGNDLGGTGVQGVYIDDRSSHLRVYGNFFFEVGNAAFKVNGGKHTTFENNVVVGPRAAFIQIHSDEAWVAWYAEEITRDKLALVGYGEPDAEWARRYPTANAMIDRTPQEPRDTNAVRRNIVVGGDLYGGIVGGAYADPEPDIGEGVSDEDGSNWVLDSDPGFADLEGGDLSLDRATLESQFPGFEWIDTAMMGPQ